MCVQKFTHFLCINCSLYQDFTFLHNTSKYQHGAWWYWGYVLKFWWNLWYHNHKNNDTINVWIFLAVYFIPKSSSFIPPLTIFRLTVIPSNIISYKLKCGINSYLFIEIILEKIRLLRTISKILYLNAPENVSIVYWACFVLWTANSKQFNPIKEQNSERSSERINDQNFPGTDWT